MQKQIEQAVDDHRDAANDGVKGAIGQTIRHEERRDISQRTAPRAVVLYEAIRSEGEDELQRPASALFWSGLAAGLSMGFSLVTQGLIQSMLPDAPWRPLLARFGYCIGFLIVILGRQQLFTENTLTPILPLLVQPRLAVVLRVLRLWSIVLVANMIGTFLFALLISHTEIFEPPVQHAFAVLGEPTMTGTFVMTLLRAIMAGWIIALMVWLLPGAEGARVSMIIIITYLVGLSGLEHIIVGSVEAFYLVLRGTAGWGDLIVKFFVPTLLGNIIGGVTLVAALNHGQVVAGLNHASEGGGDT